MPGYDVTLDVSDGSTTYSQTSTEPIIAKTEDTSWTEGNKFYYTYSIDSAQEIPNYYDHIDIQIQYTLEVPDSDNACEEDPDTGGYPFDVLWDCKLELTEDYSIGTTPFPDDIIESDNSDVSSGNLKDYSTLIQRFYGRALKKTRPAIDSNAYVLPACKFTFSVENKLSCAIGFSNIITKIAFLYYEDTEGAESKGTKNLFPLFDPANVRMNYIAFYALEGNSLGWPAGSKWFIVSVRPQTTEAINIFDTVTGATCNGVYKPINNTAGNSYAIYYQLFVDFDNAISTYLWDLLSNARSDYNMAYDYAKLVTADPAGESTNTFQVKINNNDKSRWIQVSDGTTMRFVDENTQSDDESIIIENLDVFKFGKDDSDTNYISLKYDTDVEYEATMNLRYTRFASCHVIGEDYFYDPPDNSTGDSEYDSNDDDNYAYDGDSGSSNNPYPWREPIVGPFF